MAEFILYEAYSVDAVRAAAHRAALSFEHVAETARTESDSSNREGLT